MIGLTATSAVTARIGDDSLWDILLALSEVYIEGMPDPAAFRANIGRIHPVGRTGKPEDVAALVAWLASEESGFVAGQVWTIDGGRMTKLSLP